MAREPLLPPEIVLDLTFCQLLAMNVLPIAVYKWNCVAWVGVYGLELDDQLVILGGTFSKWIKLSGCIVAVQTGSIKWSFAERKVGGAIQWTQCTSPSGLMVPAQPQIKWLRPAITSARSLDRQWTQVIWRGYNASRKMLRKNLKGSADSLR